MKKTGNRFQFGIEFQEGILRFSVTDSNGYQAVALFEDYYFELVEHQAIAAVLKSYFRKKKRIPSKVIFKEELRKAFTKRDFKELLNEENRKEVLKITERIYRGPVKQGDEILEATIKFARFVRFKDEIENVNIYDFAQYDSFSKKIQKALTIGLEYKENSGVFLIQDIRKRQLERGLRDSSFPLPITQLNRYTNAGGYYKGAVFVILDRPKRFKTGALVNIARYYMKYKKPIIIFDLENGEESYALRFEQSVSDREKRQILSGTEDRRVQKILRKYQRLGSEVVIKRLPAGSTTNDFEHWLDYYYREYGLKFGYMIVDYIALMGSTYNDKDPDARISNAYLDVKNLAERKDIIHVWTGHHVKRDAYSRRETKYQPEDTAKSIEIHRHVDAMFGLQQSLEEQESGIIRLEIIDQRDGEPHGCAYFLGKIATQRLVEFNKKQVEEYENQLEKMRESPSDEENPKPRKKLSSDV